MKVELSVIIVNYNGEKYLKDCFDSLYQKLEGIVFEIIVVDNDSRDASCEFIKTHYPDIRLLETGDNLGFGRGNNYGVKHAQGAHILLLNNDTILKDSLLPVLNFVKNDPTVGAVGITMLDGNQKYLPAAGNFPNARNMLQFKNLLAKGTEFSTGIFSKTAYEVDWLVGSFLLMPKVVYEQINGFDEDYFLYVEDVDFCKRIADAGFRCVFLPQYSYIHFVGFNPKKNPMLVKGYKIYIQKHFSGLNKAIVSLSLMVNSAVKRIKLAFQ